MRSSLRLAHLSIKRVGVIAAWRLTRSCIFSAGSVTRIHQSHSTRSKFLIYPRLQQNGKCQFWITWNHLDSHPYVRLVTMKYCCLVERRAQRVSSPMLSFSTVIVRGFKKFAIIVAHWASDAKVHLTRSRTALLLPSFAMQKKK